MSIFTESPSMDEVVKALSKLDNLEQVYEVTGEFDIVALVSAPDLDGFRNTLTTEIMKIKGVKSTVSSIVLDEQASLKTGVVGRVSLPVTGHRAAGAEHGARRIEKQLPHGDQRLSGGAGEDGQATFPTGSISARQREHCSVDRHLHFGSGIHGLP